MTVQTDVQIDVQIGMESPDQPDIIALIEELDAYQRALYPAESNHLLAIESLMTPDVLFCVARADGAPVGCGGAVMKDGYAEIKRMFVSPACRGAGLGRRMLGFIEAELRARDVPIARLETGVHSAEAIRLYARAGYHAISPFGDYRDDPLSLFFEKALVDHA